MPPTSPERRSIVQGGRYDRGEAQAEAFARVLARWRTQRPDLSKGIIAGRIGGYLGEHYWPNDVQRIYDGTPRRFHLKPKTVYAYCLAFERENDVDSVAEAFAAIEQLPPEVGYDQLRLAIAAARAKRKGNGGQNSQVA